MRSCSPRCGLHALESTRPLRAAVGAARRVAATPERGNPRAADRHFTARCRAPHRRIRPLGWLLGHRRHHRWMCGRGRSAVLHRGDTVGASRAAAQIPGTIAGSGSRAGGKATAPTNGGVAGTACRERPRPLPTPGERPRPLSRATSVLGGKCCRCEGLSIALRIELQSERSSPAPGAPASM